ncbi:glycosyltransferase [uncultured Alistipes sp.]|jgi:eps4F|uniref:glycosyltransferase n=1 Tax=uncultured Alistipes sp. TaxID=538949 RepID=UPI0025FE9011|nr:glycosyltransferase [uncultured Alistipes sp.]
MGKKIKLMHIVECAGGVDVYLKMLLPRMDRDRYTQILVCSQNYNKENYLPFVDHLEQMPMTNGIGTKDLITARKVRSLIKRYNPDVIYCHSSKGGAYGRLANVRLGYKVIYNPHGWAFNMRCGWLKHKIYLYAERIMGMLTDQFVCISEAERLSAAEARVGRPERMNVIRNGIDVAGLRSRLEEQGPLTRKSLGIAEDAFLVGMVGRITPQKAPDTFIKMAALVKKRIPGAHFIIVGDGEQAAQIREYARDNGLGDSLTITGWVTDPVPYAKLMDVACLLSRWEGFGLVLAEYMALDKPIVATNINAIPELVRHEVNGTIVEVDDAQAAADAVIRYYNDPALRQQYVQAGAGIVAQEFDIDRVVRETDELVRAVTKDGQASE